MDRHIPLISSEGMPYDRGMHLGRSARAQVTRTVQAYFSLFETLAGLDRMAVLAAAERFIGPIENYAPHLLHEMRGIAEGSGHTLLEIVALNARTELLYGVPGRSECTSLAVPFDAAADGHTWLAQNWDWHFSLAGGLVLWVLRRDDGPDLVTLTEAGMVGKIGVNAEGLALCVNLLTSDTDHSGPAVPMHVILRRVLETAGSVEEAIAIIADAPRCTSCNHLLADRQGDVADVEATPEGQCVLRSVSGTLSHTNHCLMPDLQPADLGLREGGSTLARQMRADTLLAGAGLDRHTIAAILTDHTDAPGSICRHVQDDLPWAEQLESVASIVFDLTAGTIELADGPPCQTAYRSLQLRKLLPGWVTFPEPMAV